MRIKLQGISRDSYGNVASNVDISVYLTGTTTAAKIYQSREDETAVKVAPQATTDSNGYFSLWFDDGDYANTQTFDIGTDSYTFTDVNVYRQPENNDILR